MPRPLAFLLGFLSLACMPIPINSATLSGDKAALLSFKAAVNDTGLLLASWDPTTDPCLDGWVGVSCSCDPYFTDPASATHYPVCTPLPPANGTDIPVLQLNLGDVRITNFSILDGDLPPALGSLSQLRVLNLEGHNLTGNIPNEWSQLTSLEQLILSSNNVTGTLPGWLQYFNNLKYVFLDDNQLSGPLPVEWCAGAWWFFDVRNNAGLCGPVPTCLYDRLISFWGTSLIDAVADSDQGQGGYCDVRPPTCLQLESCWVQGPNPPYWTDNTNITFSFSDFPSMQGAANASYTWRLGTSPGAGDIIDWSPFRGRNFTQAAEENMTVVTQVVHVAFGIMPSGLALRQGGQYYITVRANNGAGPLQGLSVVSNGVTVDTTPPYQPPGSSVYNTQYFASNGTENTATGFGGSWDDFVDPESGVKSYAYQVFQYTASSNASNTRDSAGTAMTSKIYARNMTSREFYISRVKLTGGRSYFVRVYATNNAGLEGYKDSPPVWIRKGRSAAATSASAWQTTSKLVILVAVLVGTISVLIAGAAFYFANGRNWKRQQDNRKYRGQMRQVRQLLNGLMERVGAIDKGVAFDELCQLKNVAFVITDLENSTKIADAVPKTYDWVQEAHDGLIRDLISAHGGYEINTEGDAFHVAFKTVAAAVLFCMEVQYQMMEVDWPREVLRLPECREILGTDGILAYRGPRVRMGIHWADENSMAQHVHTLTKHHVFTGPAFHITRDLCEAARGGQVLLSHVVWERLRKDMSSAGFPVVEQVGCFKLHQRSEPLWVYRALRLLGRPLGRLPGTDSELPGAQKIIQGAGFGVMAAPVPRNHRGDLAFISCRLALESCPAGNNASNPLAPGVHQRLCDTLAVCAMQYGGFIFRMSESLGVQLLAFPSTLDAVRFAHSAQALLMYEPWPAEYRDWSGAKEESTDGKLRFQGPRMAMAIHESNDYTTRPVPQPLIGPDGAAASIDYLGPAEEYARVLSDVAYGGQVILSEPAWRAVQGQLPGQSRVISLGTHMLHDPRFARPTMLMEVMPQALSKRVFPQPRNSHMLEPGYHDAPSVHGDVAIAQMRVVKPTKLAEIDEGGPHVGEELNEMLQVYNTALEIAVNVARDVLRRHGGYECKEPEPGKLTVAFQSLEGAVIWAARLQRELLELTWPTKLFGLEDCQEVIDASDDDSPRDAQPIFSLNDGSNTLHAGLTLTQDSFVRPAGGPLNVVLWRGLRVQIGVACGVPTSKAPLNTGRADYYGTVPNLAARLMTLAQPGQVLVDGARMSTLSMIQTWHDNVALLPGEITSNGEPVALTSLGQFAIKGLDEPRFVYQALPLGLQGRIFPENPAIVKASGPSFAPRMAPLRRPMDTLNDAKSPSARRAAIFSSISRNGSATGGSVRRGPGLFPLARTTSRLSDSSDGTATLMTSSQMRSSVLPTAGPAAGVGTVPDTAPGKGNVDNWIGRKLAAMLHLPQPIFPVRRGSGTTASGSPLSTGGYLALRIPSGSASVGRSNLGRSAGDDNNNASKLLLDPTPVPEGEAQLGEEGLRDGSATLSLRDISDWSYPVSRLATPSSTTKVIDHWDAGFAMELALKRDGLEIGPGHGSGQNYGLGNNSAQLTSTVAKNDPNYDKMQGKGARSGLDAEGLKGKASLVPTMKGQLARLFGNKGSGQER